MSLINEIRQHIRQSGKVTYQFIALNVALFLFFNILFIMERLLFRTGAIAEFYRLYLALPALPETLLTRPWTLVTYMFLHANLLHIFFNMLFLYWFGRLLEEYLGSRKLTALYFLGGLAGALLYILSYNIFPYLRDQAGGAFLIGASASVMAILVAAATLLPDYTFFLLLLGPVRLKYIALILVILDFLSIAGSNPGGMLAHLGGAALGFVFVRQLRQGRDWSKPIMRFFDAAGRLFKRRPHLKATPGGRRYAPPPSPRVQQDEIDAILDKISKSGYDSLSPEEKEKLFRASGKE